MQLRLYALVRTHVRSRLCIRRKGMGFTDGERLRMGTERSVMIQASVRIVAPTEKREEILDVMQRTVGPTEVSKGCLSCHILFDAENDDAITYVMRWDTKSDLQEHLSSDRFRRLLPYMELSLSKPEVEVSIVEPIGGMELLVSSVKSHSE